jgi:hypothetical protein
MRLSKKKTGAKSQITNYKQKKFRNKFKYESIRAYGREGTGCVNKKGIALIKASFLKMVKISKNVSRETCAVKNVNWEIQCFT